MPGVLVLATGPPPGPLDGFVLAGAEVVRVPGPDEAAAAWGALDPGVGLVILDPDAAAVVERRRAEHPDVLVAVWP